MNTMSSPLYECTLMTTIITTDITHYTSHNVIRFLDFIIQKLTIVIDNYLYFCLKLFFS